MTEPSERLSSWAPASVVVHSGRPPRGAGEAVNAPIVLSSIYQQGGDLAYGRDGNATWSAFEEVLGDLEGGRRPWATAGDEAPGDGEWT